MASIGIGTAVDLRSSAERAGGGYQLPVGQPESGSNVLADNPDAAAFSRLFGQGKLQTISAHDTESFMLNSYRDMVDLPSGTKCLPAHVRDYRRTRVRRGVDPLHGWKGSNRLGQRRTTTLAGDGRG